MFPYTCTPTSLNVLYGSRMRTLNSTHPDFKRAVDLVKAIAAAGPMTALVDELEGILDIRKFIARITFGRVQVGDKEVHIDGNVSHSYVTQRLLEMVRADFNVMPMLRFIDKLLLNPTTDVREDMWKWLEHGGMPLCEDGDFIAFKKVKPDFYDYYTGTVLHSVGTRVSQPREDCNDSRDVPCAEGLHFCSYDYLDGYRGREGRVLILKINPKDVVAIPREYKLSKGRACSYFVQDTVPEDEAAKFFDGKPVVMYDAEPPQEAYENYDSTDEGTASEATAYKIETPEEEQYSKVTSVSTNSLRTVIPRAERGAGFLRNLNLENAFYWDSTPQGSEHWRSIALDECDASAEDIAWLKGLLAYAEKKDALLSPPSQATDVVVAGAQTGEVRVVEGSEFPDAEAVMGDEYKRDDDDDSACACELCRPEPEVADTGAEPVAVVDLETDGGPTIQFVGGYANVRSIDGAQAVRAYLSGRDDAALIRAFIWDSTPQGWAHWDARWKNPEGVTAADREWMQGLLNYWKPQTDWVTAMRRD